MLLYKWDIPDEKAKSARWEAHDALESGETKCKDITILELCAIVGHLVVQDGRLRVQVAGVASAEAGRAARNKVNLQALVEIHEDDVEHVHQQQDYRLVPVTSTTVKVCI